MLIEIRSNGLIIKYSVNEFSIKTKNDVHKYKRKHSVTNTGLLEILYYPVVRFPTI